MTTRAPLTALLALATLTFAASAWPRSAHGPNPGHTGGFGEPTCRACHFDGPENPTDATLRIEGLPAAWAPDSTYAIGIVLRGESLPRGGFQAAVRFASGAEMGRQAGDLTGNEHVAITTAGDVAYAHHVLASTHPATLGELRWNLLWRAPGSATGRVVLHVAANAANDDNSELGDRIVTANATLDPLPANPAR